MSDWHAENLSERLLELSNSLPKHRKPTSRVSAREYLAAGFAGAAMVGVSCLVAAPSDSAQQPTPEVALMSTQWSLTDGGNLFSASHSAPILHAPAAAHARGPAG